MYSYTSTSLESVFLCFSAMVELPRGPRNYVHSCRIAPGSVPPFRRRRGRPLKQKPPSKEESAGKQQWVRQWIGEDPRVDPVKRDWEKRFGGELRRCTRAVRRPTIPTTWSRSSAVLARANRYCARLHAKSAGKAPRPAETWKHCSHTNPHR